MMGQTGMAQNLGPLTYVSLNSALASTGTLKPSVHTSIGASGADAFCAALSHWTVGSLFLSYNLPCVLSQPSVKLPSPATPTTPTAATTPLLEQQSKSQQRLPYQRP